jgi:hypothetical protein
MNEKSMNFSIAKTKVSESSGSSSAIFSNVKRKGSESSAGSSIEIGNGTDSDCGRRNSYQRGTDQTSQYGSYPTRVIDIWALGNLVAVHIMSVIHVFRFFRCLFIKPP